MKSMDMVSVGIDLAKKVVALNGVDSHADARRTSDMERQLPPHRRASLSSMESVVAFHAKGI